MRSVDVMPNMMMWFGSNRPWPAGSTERCHHYCAHGKQEVVAWGPSLSLYEIVECQRCGCRNWTFTTTPFGSLLGGEWKQLVETGQLPQ